MTSLRPHMRFAPQCPFCDGSGDCYRCEGRGFHMIRVHRWSWQKRIVPCRVCDASGVCQLCRDGKARETDPGPHEEDAG